MAKKLEKLEVVITRLSKKHKALKGVVDGVIDNLEEGEKEDERLAILCKRLKKRIEELAYDIEILKEKNKKKSKDIKSLVSMHLFNEKSEMVDKWSKKQAERILRRYVKQNLTYKTTQIKATKITVKKIKELGDEGYRLAATLEPPVVKNTTLIFQKEVMGKEKLEREPA
jgi:hypothetical protein